jgi:hypothetical protein
MYLCYTDETNVDAKSDFFIYGGIIIAPESAASLSADIDAIRKARSFKPEDDLKFTGANRPEHISPDDHKEAKAEVLRAAASRGVKLLAVLSHQKIVAKDFDRARTYGINIVCANFDRYLDDVGSVGIVLVDRFDDALLAEHLREKFSVGLTFSGTTTTRKLDRVLAFHQAFIGTSHFASVIDIVLGAFRFAVNNRNDPTKAMVVKELLTLVGPLFLNPVAIPARSLYFTPERVMIRPYFDECLALRQFLVDNGVAMEHQPRW